MRQSLASQSFINNERLIKDSQESFFFYVFFLFISSFKRIYE